MLEIAALSIILITGLKKADESNPAFDWLALKTKWILWDK